VTADWRWTLALKFEGHAREVDAARENAEGIIRGAGGRLEGQSVPARFWEVARDWAASPADDEVVLSGLAPLTGLEKLVLGGAPLGSLMAQPAAGALDIRVPAEAAASALERLRQAAGSEGQVIVGSAPPAAKKSLDVWGRPPAAFPLMRSLKQALDPNATLNPGRFVGGL